MIRNTNRPHKANHNYITKHLGIGLWYITPPPLTGTYIGLLSFIVGPTPRTANNVSELGLLAVNYVSELVTAFVFSLLHLSYSIQFS